MTDTGFGRHDVQAATAGNELPFRFNGSGKEYFGIWIVNILLTIITLGIYSAWAKVRNKRYFNGNTELDGHRFDYHANPIQILKGRIIVVVVLVIMNILANLNLLLALGVAAFYAVALPWVIVRGLRFNANMTSYRNLRFHFENTKWNAFKAYILLPILPVIFAIIVLASYVYFVYGFQNLGGVVPSFALIVGASVVALIVLLFTLALIPFISRANARFLGNGHIFGQSQFAADPPLRPYYSGLGISIAILIGFLIISVLLLYFGFGQFSGLFDDGSGENGAKVKAHVDGFAAIPIYLAFIVAFIAYAAISRNVGFNALKLQEGHQFRSTLTVKGYSWILITNFLLMIITLGIYIPWAKVRAARYLADNTFMIANGDLDRFVEGQVDDRGVASGEFLDIEGIDFGF